LPMPVGTIALIVVGVLIYFGVLHRVLDRMRLSDRAALLVLALLIAGSLFDFSAQVGRARIAVNVGGGLVPIGVAVYLVATADEVREKWRAAAAAAVTGIVVFALGKVLPAEPEAFVIEPMYLYGLSAGVMGYLAGRSRRASLVAGTMGIVLADLGHAVEIAAMRLPGRAWVGGAGVFDTVVISGLIAVALAEVVGGARERAVLTAREDSRRDGGQREDHRARDDGGDDRDREG